MLTLKNKNKQGFFILLYTFYILHFPFELTRQGDEGPTGWKTIRAEHYRTGSSILQQLASNLFARVQKPIKCLPVSVSARYLQDIPHCLANQMTWRSPHNQQEAQIYLRFSRDQVKFIRLRLLIWSALRLPGWVPVHSFLAHRISPWIVDLQWYDVCRELFSWHPRLFNESSTDDEHPIANTSSLDLGSWNVNSNWAITIIQVENN